MKKLSLFASALALMLCGTFTSCSVEDNAVEGNGTVDPPTKEIEVEEFVASLTYDFAAEQALIAAGTVEKPGNVGGSEANGQAFFGWESDNKTDSKRQDYKGYSKKDGSTLPETCNIWRRSDRFDQDASWNTEGGVKMPNDRQFAIDGLEEGSIVVITYTSADESQIVWAIGDGSSQKLETARATATIDGVEAVPGETAIPSGAIIAIKSVTPAANGTGYIVLQVKKNMVISKIEIGKIETVKKTITM